jgi:uncharacterized membrane protein
LVTAQSRRWFGGALVVLDIVLAWQSLTNEGFRFIWMADEGELFLLEVAVGLVGLILLATSFQSSRPAAGAAASAAAGGRHWLVRVAVYLSGVVVAVIVAFFIGVSSYEAKYCGQVASCDDDDLSGLVWGVTGSLIALAVGVVLIVVNELVLRSRRERRKVGTPA